MKLLALAALFAATAFSAPLNDADTYFSPSGTELKIRGTGDQGDGYYLAQFNEEGVADVVFTPYSELNLTALEGQQPVLPAPKDAGDELAARGAGALEGRDAGGCTGSGYLPDIDQANYDLARLSQKVFPQHSWGWVCFYSPFS